MLRRAASLLVVNLIVFAVVAELIALAVFYYQTGWLYYVDPYRPQLAVVAEPRGGRLITAALHPYFGPTHQPGIPFDMPEALREPGASNDAPRPATNNFGFTSRHDYPVARTSERQLLVGIFGGSVGAWFCQVGAGRLAAALARRRRSSGRDVVPLCFSHEGYKQPQQLLMLELLPVDRPGSSTWWSTSTGSTRWRCRRSTTREGSDISMPSVMHMDPLDRARRSVVADRREGGLAGAHPGLPAAAERGWPSRANRSWFAAADFGARRDSTRVLDRQYRDEVRAFDALPSRPRDSMVRVTPQAANARRRGAVPGHRARTGRRRRC